MACSLRWAVMEQSWLQRMEQIGQKSPITTGVRSSLSHPAETFALHSAKRVSHYYYDFPNFSTLVSSNGADWIISGTNVPLMSDLASSGGLFVGVGGNCVFTTVDGFNWASNCISSNTLHGIAWAKDRFLAVGDGATIFSSFDGLSWSKSSL